MAVDTRFDNVTALLQGGDLTNEAPSTSAWIVSANGVTTGATLALSQSGGLYIEHPSNPSFVQSDVDTDLVLTWSGAWPAVSEQIVTSPKFTIETTGVPGQLRIVSLQWMTASNPIQVAQTGSTALRISFVKSGTSATVRLRAVWSGGSSDITYDLNWSSAYTNLLPLRVGNPSTGAARPATASEVQVSSTTIQQGMAATPTAHKVAVNITWYRADAPQTMYGTIFATKNGVQHSYAVGLMSGGGGAGTLLSLLALGIVQIIGGTLESVTSASDRATVNIITTPGADGANWTFSVQAYGNYGAWGGYAAQSNLQANQSATVITNGQYGAPPGAQHIQAISYLIGQSGSYTTAVTVQAAGVNAGIPYTTSNAPLTASGMSQLVQSLAALGINGSWSQPTASQYLLTLTTNGPGAMTASAAVSATQSGGIVSSIEGLRITQGGLRADAPTAAPLPWPTSSIPASSGGGGGGTLTDPNVWLALNFEGGFQDQSGYAHAVAVNSQVTASPPAVNPSRTGDTYVYADNAMSVLNYNADLNELNGLTALTIEFDIFVPPAAGQGFFMGATGGVYMAVVSYGSGTFDITPNGWSVASLQTAYGLSAGAWHHVAFVYDGAQARTYADGVQGIAQPATGALDFSVNITPGTGTNFGVLNIANPPGAYTTLPGLSMDNVVITKTAKYTANFTPPGAVAAGVTDPTLLLLHFDEGTGATTDDASPYNHTVNVTNYAAGAAAGKFSGGLDLSLAQATISQNTGKFVLGATWTIEFFVKANSATALTVGGQPIVMFVEPYYWYPGWGVEMSLGRPVLYRNGANWLGTAYAGLSDQNWHHVALACDGTGNTWLFVDGVIADFAGGATTLSGPNTHTNLTIGWDGVGGAYPLSQYTIDELRISRTCLYTGAFTPPALPFADFSGGGTAPTSDIQGAGYNTIDDFTSTGEGNQQATFPPSYGSGSATLDDFYADQSIVVDNDSVNGTSSRTLANFTNTGSWVAADPTNADGATTLDDFVGDGSAVASEPIEITADAVLEDFTQIGVAMFLAPSEGVGDILLDEFTGDAVVEIQTPPTAQIIVTMRMPTATASGYQKSDRVAASMPRASAAASGHGVASGSMRAPSVSAAGTVVNMGSVAATMPLFEVQATGRVAGSGSVQVFMPSSYELVGYGGAVVSATVGEFTAQATGISGTVGLITATLPMVVVEAVGSRVNTGQVDAVMPMLVPSPSGRISAVLPMVRVVASGDAVVAVSHEAYVLNMSKPMDDNPRNNFEARNDQMTRYTNFPFTQVVRYLNSYYGVAADGLYLLDGTTDNGAPINWNIDLCMTDFGSSEKKNVASVYLGGQAGPKVDFTIQSGETPDQLHAHTTTATTVKRNHRQKFGLGRRTRYYSLGLAGQGELAIDSLEFEVATTTRRI